MSGLRILTSRESIAPDLDALVLPADDGPLFPLIIEVVTALEEGEEIGERAESEMRACVLEVRTQKLSYWEQNLMPPGIFVRAPDDALGAALGVDEMNERFTKRSRTRAISCTRPIPPAMRRLRRAIDAMPAGEERTAAEALFVQLTELSVRVGVDDDQKTTPTLLGGIFPVLRVGERDERPVERPAAPEPEPVVAEPEAVPALEPEPEAVSASVAALEPEPETASASVAEPDAAPAPAFDAMNYGEGHFS